MDHIKEIRRKNGYDNEMLKRIAKDPDIESSMKATLENLERALRNLSEELYSKSTHFIFEFIQNADDNTYAIGVVPTLRMRVEDRRASFRCNEVGFNRENVDAICRVGTSTKKNIQGYIGEKGIGFKSVFKVADEVYISSGPYTFKFDKGEKLGMITPIWTDNYPVQTGWTSFHLHLFEDGEKLAYFVDDIKPTVLLFLRKLRSLTIEVAMRSSFMNKIIKVHRYETDDPDIVTLERVMDGSQTGAKEIKLQRTEIVLAFPIANDRTPEISAQEVHAFLPLRKYGFTFIIQADFLTSSSREDILSDLQWNLTLRAGVVEAFSRAVKHFQQRPSDAFFTPLADAINQRLRRAPIFRTMDGVYRLPSEVVILPARFCDDAGQPLIPRRFLTAGMDYLSPEYDVHADGVRFEDLGVCEMDDTFFICCLRRMEGQFSEQSDSWHEAVCLALFNDLQRIPKYKRNGRLTEIRRLCLLPLSDGRWISSSNLHNDVFFDLKAYNIPNDLGLRSLKTGIKKSSSRYRLFDQLGVKVADPAIVGQKILELHEGCSYWTGSLTSLICHAQFMFTYRSLRPFPASSNLKVMDELGSIARGSELYMDLPDSQSMLEMLPRPPARFIHPAYLQEHRYNDELKQDWLRWLCDSLLVNVCPRLIDGDLSAEFVTMTNTLNSRQLLLVLKASWFWWERELSRNAITKLAQISVSCEDGSLHALSATYIGKKSLRNFDHFGLPFLPIDDPDDDAWKFLKNFGVATEVDGSFFLKRLIQLKGAVCSDRKLVENTYKQLEARFREDPNGIRRAFQNDPLIFVFDQQGSKAWIGINEVVWNGPPAMKSKFALKSMYPFLEDFFCVKLGVANPPMHDILVHEINLITEEWKERTLMDAVSHQVPRILSNMSDLIEMGSDGRTATWLDDLRDKPIFPVNFPTGVQLFKASDHFYIPDNEKYRKMCTDEIPLLSIDKTELYQIQPLLDSQTFKPCLQYLSNAVHCSSAAIGPRILDDAFTTKYHDRMMYVKRLVYHTHRSDPPSNVLKNLESMKHIAVFSVDSIETTFSIDDFTFPGEDNIAIEMEPTKVSILMSQGCQNAEWDIPICKRLERELVVPKDRLLVIVLQPAKGIEAWMDSERIPDIDVHSSRDRSWLIDANPSTPLYLDHAWQQDASPLFSRQVANTNEESGYGASRKPGNALGPNWGATDFRNEMEHAMVALSGPVRGHPPPPEFPSIIAIHNPTKSGTAYTSSMGPDLPQIAAEECVVSAAGAHARVAHFMGESVTTMYAQENGLLGEYGVYNLFLKELPGFGPDNWTSELRGLAPGMTPYEGPPLVDFVYPDEEGVLTESWFGEEKMEAWRDKWPVYHVEVKTTSGTAQETFHMSRRQLEIALNLSLNMRDQNSIPKEIFVLLRVCGVRTSNPSFEPYPDPYQCFYEGKLRIVSNVDVLPGRYVKGSPDAFL